MLLAKSDGVQTSAAKLMSHLVAVYILAGKNLDLIEMCTHGPRPLQDSSSIGVSCGEDSPNKGEGFSEDTRLA